MINLNFNRKNFENSFRNKMIEKISDSFLYLNFSDIENFQNEAMEYIITISILFRRKEIKFVIENWIFEVNLTDEINQEISKARKSHKHIFSEGFNIQKRIYTNKKLDILSRTIKSLLNFLPSIKLFHGNSFDFFLDFEINFEDKSQKDKIKQNKNDKILNVKYLNKNENSEEIEKLGYNDDIVDINNDFDIFCMNSLKIKTNQEIKKENTNIPIKRQIELIKFLTNSKKIFHYYETSYNDKIGKIKLYVDYVDKCDVFFIEEEINKSISHLERINKRKRFLSENSNDYIYKDIKNEGANPFNNNNVYNKEEFSQDLIIFKNLKNSFFVDCTNNSPSKNKINERSINENSKFFSKEINNFTKYNLSNLEQKDFNQNTNTNNRNIYYNHNIINNKTVKLFENIIPNCSINNNHLNKLEDEVKGNKGDKRINTKSEEKNYSKSIFKLKFNLNYLFKEFLT